MLYNKQNGIRPRSVNRPIQESLRESLGDDKEDLMEVSEAASNKDLKKLIKQLETEMLAAVKKLEFEKAALLRDQIEFLKQGKSTKKTLRKVKYPSQARSPKRYGRKKS